MIIEFYIDPHRRRPTFDPPRSAESTGSTAAPSPSPGHPARPGHTTPNRDEPIEQHRLVVPGGSEVLPTRVGGPDPESMLFVPTADPLQFTGWTARQAVAAARSGCSPFRLVLAPRKTG